MYYLMVLIPAMLWGSIAVFIDGIPISSTQVAFYRTVLGSLSLIMIYLFSKNKMDIKAVKKNILKLVLAGGCIGANWIALFEGYRLASVSVVTVVYYLSPIIVMAVSPYLFKEKLTFEKVLGMSTAFLGLIAVSFSAGVGEVSVSGIISAFIGAILYAIACILNKTINGISGFNVAMIELVMGAVLVFIYTFMINGETLNYPGDRYMINLIIIGVVHTGVAYGVYMSAIQKVSMQTIAILSFAEPIFAIIFSAVILKEVMTFWQIIGAVCVIGGAMFAELYKRKS